VTPEETAAITGLCNAADLVEHRCPACREVTERHREHWQPNPAPYPGGRWWCPRDEAHLREVIDRCTADRVREARR